MTQKYGAWTVPGARETARIAWRERVNAAARDWMTSGARTLWLSLPWHPLKPYSWRLHDALTAPRPWRSSRRPDPRRRYSRRHRMGCWWCSTAKWLEVRHIGNEEMTRDPHGFRRHHFAMHGRRS